jgi:DNA-binding NarL/FixJ family response regulator
MRCLIVDDNQGFLAAARGLLEREGITIVGVASNSADALRSCQKLQPDVTLVDVDLGDESGFDLAELLHHSGLSAVILISTYEAEDFGELIAISHAEGFLSKSNLSACAIRNLVGGSASPEEGQHG